MEDCMVEKIVKLWEEGKTVNVNVKAVVSGVKVVGLGEGKAETEFQLEVLTTKYVDCSTLLRHYTKPIDSWQTITVPAKCITLEEK